MNMYMPSTLRCARPLSMDLIGLPLRIGTTADPKQQIHSHPELSTYREPLTTEQLCHSMAKQQQQRQQHNLQQQQQQRSEGRLITLARHLLAPDDAARRFETQHQVCEQRDPGAKPHSLALSVLSCFCCTGATSAAADVRGGPARTAEQQTSGGAGKHHHQPW